MPSIELIAKKNKLAFEEHVPAQINNQTFQAMLAKIGANEKALKVPVDYGSLSIQIDLRESQVRAILSHLCSVFAFMA